MIFKGTERKFTGKMGGGGGGGGCFTLIAA